MAIMYGYIYRTTNKINGKIYIGQHKGDFDPKYLGSGTILLRSVKKYGKDNFLVEIIEKCESSVLINDAEILQIKSHRECTPDLVINIASGGGSGHQGPFSSEHIAKIAAMMRTPERRALSSRIHKGKTIPIERRLAHSAFMKGRIPSEETRKKMSEAQKIFNPTRSEESNKKRSETLKGRVITEEWRQRISDGHRRRRETKLLVEQKNKQQTGVPCV